MKAKTWEDTVLSDDETEKAFRDDYHVMFDEPLPSCAARNSIAQKQAQVAYKAGQEAERKKKPRAGKKPLQKVCSNYGY